MQDSGEKTKEEIWSEKMWVKQVGHFMNRKSVFCISQYSFEKLVEKLTPAFAKQVTNFRKAILIQKLVAITLWRLSTGNTFFTGAKMFGGGTFTTSLITKEFCEAISQISGKLI